MDFSVEDIVSYTKECCESCPMFPKNLDKNQEFIAYVMDKMKRYEAKDDESLNWQELYENAVEDMDEVLRKMYGFAA